jgi:hypothetical protein
MRRVEGELMVYCCELGFCWEVAKQALVKMYVVCVLGVGVAVEAAWDVGPVPHRDLCASFNWH